MPSYPSLPAMQVSTPKGPMNVAIPAGLAAGQEFEFMLP